MKIRTVCTCPLEIVHDIMRGKWKTIIVFQLRNGGMGLAELCLLYTSTCSSPSSSGIWPRS